MPRDDLIQFRRGTAAAAAAANPVLAAGEPGVETDTDVFAIGNGTDAWNDLPKIRLARDSVTIYNVVAYGAVGDGVTNAAAEVQLAVNAAILDDNGVVYFPPGTYLLGSTTIYLTADATVTGAPRGVALLGAGMDASTITYTGSGDAFSSGTTTSTPGAAFTARNLTITGTGSTGNARGLYLKRFQRGSGIYGVRIQGFAYTNLHTYRCYGFVVDEASHIVSAGGWGWRCDNSNGHRASGGSRFTTNTLGGVLVYFNDGTAPHDEAGAAAAQGSFDGCLMEQNGGPAVRYEKASGQALENCYIEGNGGSGGNQVEVTGAAAASQSFVKIAKNRFQAVGAGITSGRAVYVDYGEVVLDANQSFNHTTGFCETTANGHAQLLSHRDGTREGGSDGDAAVLVGQTLNELRSLRSVGIPFTLQFTLTTPAAGVTNGDLNLIASALTTDRLDSAGMRWEVNYLTVRSTVAPTAGTITFFPKSGTTALNAQLAAVMTTGELFEAEVGNARSASAGAVIGAGYTTDASYAAAAAEYTIVMSGRLVRGLL